MNARDLINTKSDDIKQRKIKRRRERDLSDIRFIIKSPEGRRFFWGVMSEGGMFRDAFSGDIGLTNYNLGRQSVSSIS